MAGIFDRRDLFVAKRPDTDRNNDGFRLSKRRQRIRQVVDIRNQRRVNDSGFYPKTKDLDLMARSALDWGPALMSRWEDLVVSVSEPALRYCLSLLDVFAPSLPVRFLANRAHLACY